MSMFQYESVNAPFEALRVKHPEHAPRFDRAQSSFIKWAMSPTINDPDGAAGAVRAHADGKMFCGNAEKLAAVTCVFDSGVRPGYLVAHVIAREGLAPDLAHVLALDTQRIAARAGCDFNFDTWRLMSHDAINEKIGALYGHVVISAMQECSEEPNLAYAMSEFAPPPEDLRPTCVLRLQTLHMDEPAWTVLERQSVRADHDSAFLMHVYTEDSDRYHRLRETLSAKVREQRELSKQMGMASQFGVGQMDAYRQALQQYALDPSLIQKMSRGMTQQAAPRGGRIAMGTDIHEMFAKNLDAVESRLDAVEAARKPSFMETITGRIKKPGDQS